MNNYGFSDSQWSAAKQEVKEILSKRAKVRGMMPYSELVSKMTTISLEAYDQRLFHLLGEVSIEEDTAGRGMLTVIVVHKLGDMQPGQGFFELAESLGRDTSNILDCWITELKKYIRFGRYKCGLENY